MSRFLIALAGLGLVACGGPISIGDLHDGGAGGGTGVGGGGGAGGTKRIFITTLQYTGDLGGLAGADQKCNTEAQAAGAGGTWKAWLSDATTDALTRIVEVGPWADFGKFTKTIFNNKATLQTIPLAPLYYDARGQQSSGNSVWTGTDLGGTKSASHCHSWTSSSSSFLESGAVGYAGNATAQWTQGSVDLCNTKNSIYCIEE